MDTGTVGRTALEEAIAIAAEHLGITRAGFLEALGPRVLDQMIAAAAAGVESGRISTDAAKEGIALAVGYLHPRHYPSESAAGGRPVPETSAEFLAALEVLAAEHGVALEDLIHFLREAAEMRIADALTVLRLLDRVEDLKRSRLP